MLSDQLPHATVGLQMMKKNNKKQNKINHFQMNIYKGKERKKEALTNFQASDKTYLAAVAVHGAQPRPAQL